MQYLVTFIGKGNSKQVVADDPQSALEMAWGGNKLDIKYLDAAQASKANVRVELVGGKKKSVNYYFAQDKGVNAQPQVNKNVAQRLSLVDAIKDEVKKERDRQIYAGERRSDSEIDAFADALSLKRVVANARKEGKPTSEVGKIAVREGFKKLSTDVEETIMQSEGIDGSYTVVTDPTQFKTVINNHACLILQKKQTKGVVCGVTAFFGTGNKAVIDKMYGDPLTYPLLKITKLYTDFLNITERKVQDIKNNRVYTGGTVQGKTQVRVASCSVRFKQKTVKKNGVDTPTGKMTLSSLEYSAVLENVICIIALQNPTAIINNANTALGNLMASPSYTQAQIEDSFGFNFDAYNLAKMSIIAISRPLTTEEQNLFDKTLNEAFEKAEKKAGISKADGKLYFNNKAPNVLKDMSYIVQQAKTGKYSY